MDALIVKMLQSRGISRLHAFIGLDIPHQFYGYVEDGLFHICDSNLKEEDLSLLFAKRYIIITEFGDSWAYSKNNQYDKYSRNQRNQHHQALLVDTTTSQILSYADEFSISPNGCFIFKGLRTTSYSKTTKEVSLNKWFTEIRDYHKCVINDTIVKLDYLCHVIGNWQYVVTAFPYTIYNRNGKPIAVIPEGYACVGYIAFGNGHFILLFFNPEKERTIVYSSRKRKKCEIDQHIFPDNAIINEDTVLFSETIAHYSFNEYKCHIVDQEGRLLDDGIIDGRPIGFKDGLVSYEGHNESGSYLRFENLSGTINGQCRYRNKAVVLSKWGQDPRFLKKNSTLYGLMNVGSHTMIIPFCYDSIEHDEYDDFPIYDGEIKYEDYSYSIVYQDRETGNSLQGLFIDDKIVFPVSDCSIRKLEENEMCGLDHYFWIENFSGKNFLYYPHCDPIECDSYSIANNALLVWKNGAAAVVLYGKIITDYLYSEAKWASGGYCYVYDKSGRVGLIHKDKGVLLVPTYKSLVYRCVGFEPDNAYVIADQKLYSITGELLFDPGVGSEVHVKYLLDEISFQVVVGNNIFDDSGQLRFEADKHSLSFQSYDYTNMIYAFKQCDGEYIFYNDEFKELTNGEDYSREKGRIIFSNNRAFNKDDGQFEDCEPEDSYSPCCDDDVDYDRDTYYALGGYDYDEFKRNGGDIDSMMDGMGF